MNGNHRKQCTGLTSGLTVGDVGRFAIGNGNGLTEPAVMNFYGLFIYNRSLTDNESKLLHLFLINNFKIQVDNIMYLTFSRIGELLSGSDEVWY